jgi:hypothetical protein
VNGIIAQTVSNKFTSDSAADKVTAVSNDINSLIDKSQALGNSQGTSVIIQDNDHSLRELIKDQINRHVTFIGGSDETLRSDPADIPFRAACGSVLQSLWPGAAAFDLLSRGRHEEPKVPVALTVVLLAALVIALALFLTLPLKADKEQLQALSHEIQVKEKEYKEVETLQKEISGLESEVIFIRNFNTGTSSLAILNELTQLLPGTAWLSNVTITESTVSIVGFADSASVLI